MTAPDRIAVYWTAIDDEVMPARLLAQTPKSPIFAEDLPKSARIEYIRADLATPQSWDDVNGTKHVQFPATLAAMTPEVRALVEQWDDYVESMGSVMGEVEHMAQQMRDALAALRGIGGEG